MGETRTAPPVADAPARGPAHPLPLGQPQPPLGRYLRCRTRGPVPVTALFPAALQQLALADLARVPAMLACFIERLGPHPFDACLLVIADDPARVPASPGAAVLRSDSIDGSGSCDGALADAIARQWFARGTKGADARDAWLVPALARYATWLWCEAAGDMTTDALAGVEHARLAGRSAGEPRDAPEPQGAPDDPRAGRGALLLHALRIELGDVRFFELLQACSLLHPTGAGTTDGFRELVGAFAERPVDVLLDAWLVDAGLPPAPERRRRAQRRHRR